jgi:hypothetical protein
VKLTWPPRDPAADYIEKLQTRVDNLEEAVLHWQRAELAARRQAEALQLRLVVQDTTPEELARMRATLLDYEDQLATCRAQHGGNTRSDTTAVTR